MPTKTVPNDDSLGDAPLDSADLEDSSQPELPFVLTDPNVSRPHLSRTLLGSILPTEGAAFAALLVLFLVSRVLTVVLLRPGGFFGDWSDFNYYFELGELAAQGYYPYIHYWSEYPPVLPWLVVLVYEFTRSIPPWRHQLIWFGLTLSGVLIFAEAISLLVVRRLGRRLYGAEGGLLCAFLYSILFLPLYGVAVWMDALPVCLLLLGLELGLAGRPLLAGLVSGFGVGVKLYPSIVAPAVFSTFGSLQRRLRYLFGIIVSAAVIFAPFALINREMLWASLWGMTTRRPWESVWALIDGYYGTGTVPALADRLLYPESAFWTTPTRLPWLAVTAVFGALFLASWIFYNRQLRSADRVTLPRLAVSFAALSVALFLLYSKGFSQQFTLLLLPFIVILWPGWRGALVAAALMLNNTLVEGYLYVNLFPDNRWLLRGTIVVRTLILVGIALVALSELSPRLLSLRNRLQAPLTWLSLIIAAMLLVGSGLALGGQYVRVSQINNPYRALSEAIRTEPEESAIIITSSELYAALYPEIRPRPSLLLVDPKLPERPGQTSLHSKLLDFVEGRASVVLVEGGLNTEGSPEAENARRALQDAAKNWLSRHFSESPPREIAGAKVTVYRAMSRKTLSEPTLFGNSIRLEAVDIRPEAPKPGQPLRVILDWRAVGPIDRDYTAFLHLYDSAGKLVVQRDTQPLSGRYPTSIWRVDEPVVDEIDLTLPEALTNGAYRLVIGLYDAGNGRRLNAMGGKTEERDRLVIDEIRIGQ